MSSLCGKQLKDCCSWAFFYALTLMKAMRGRIALQKHFRAKSVEPACYFREAFRVRTRPRVAFPDGEYFYAGSRQIDNWLPLRTFPA